MHQVKTYILEQVASGRLHKESAARMFLEMEEHETGVSGAASEGNNKYAEPEPVSRVPGYEDAFPLLPAQKMILLHQFMKRDTAYNIPRALFLVGKADITQINAVFQQLVKRHRALRTSFHLARGEYIQKVNDQVDFSVEYVKISKGAAHDDLDDFIKRFNLEQAPLFRVRLVKYAEQEYLLLMDIHHIIADRKSIAILINEFHELYRGSGLPEIKHHYGHYVEWYNRFMASEEGKQQESFWLEQFQDGHMTTELKTDFAKEGISKYTEGSHYYEFADEYRDTILRFCTESGITLNMLMLSAYYVLLGKWLEQDDLVVGLSCEGRTRPWSRNIIGMFVNMLPIRNYPSSRKTFEGFLKDTRDILLKAYANQEYPFDVLTEKVIPKLNIEGKLVNTLFIMQSTDYGDLELEGLQVKAYHDYIETDGRFDLQVNVFNTAEKHLNVCFIYSKELFTDKTVKMLLREYISILEQAVDTPGKLLSDFEIKLS